MPIILNQLYRQKKTLENRPDIKLLIEELKEFARRNKFVGKEGRVKGRIYDDALLYFSDGVDFKGKIVCELGARDGIFSSWLTKFVKKIYVSDYFEEWGKGTKEDLRGFEYWKNIWKNAAIDPSKMVCETQNILNLSYEDEMFDIVICTSVIEHLYNQRNLEGDIIGIKEIARITKPDGYILLSTDMGEKCVWYKGTLYYDHDTLFKRLIEPSGCIINGEYDFSFDNKDNDVINTIEGIGKTSPVVFCLKKPNVYKKIYY